MKHLILLAITFFVISTSPSRALTVEDSFQSWATAPDSDKMQLAERIAHNRLNATAETVKNCIDTFPAEKSMKLKFVGYVCAVLSGGLKKEDAVGRFEVHRP